MAQYIFINHSKFKHIIHWPYAKNKERFLRYVAHDYSSDTYLSLVPAPYILAHF